MDDLFKKELINGIVSAARTAFIKLFSNGETFYYAALLTTGDGCTPCVSAWSLEALEREADHGEECELIKWSYADSPYYAWEDDVFGEVSRLLSLRPFNFFQNEDAWAREIALRMEAMAEALKILDYEGMFSKNQPREDIVVLAQFMPPDFTDTKRAYHLNDKSSHRFQEWLDEAAE